MSLLKNNSANLQKSPILLDFCAVFFKFLLATHLAESHDHDHTPPLITDAKIEKVFHGDMACSRLQDA
jgi:hypothetical protein